MVENRRFGSILSHASLWIGLLFVCFPVYFSLVAASHSIETIIAQGIPAWPGLHLFENIKTVLTQGPGPGVPPLGQMLFNSLLMALGIAIGKIIISLLAAFAVVYFRFPFRMLFFWMIFFTLMLPVEVRIMPTYAVVTDLRLLNSYGGLIIPLIASATATFLFRQFFLSVPDELAEAARIDGAGPMRFFKDVLLPLSRTSIAAMFVIQFIYGWNQYLWPLLITTEEQYYTIVMGISLVINTIDDIPNWNLVMTTSLLAMLPPVIIVLAMQRQFVKGLVETEK